MKKALIVLSLSSIVFWSCSGNNTGNGTDTGSINNGTGGFNSTGSMDEEDATGTSLMNTGSLNADEFVVEITSEGFSPNTLNLDTGDTVTFLNTDSKNHWVASNNHPTHTLYPGSDIKKCGTPEENAIFDACRGIRPTESYSFTFENKGTWLYHDHLNPRITGRIVVQ